jgi:Holliday junction resolvase RusA-like endonuclease
MIAFHLPIEPPRSTSQGKRLLIVKGRPMFFKKKEHQAAENDLLMLCSKYAPAAPLNGPVSLCVELVFPWRKGETKARMQAGRQPHTTLPDCDNAVKMIGDVLTKLRFYTDDSQVSELIVRKWWGSCVGISIKVETISPVAQTQLMFP